MKRTGVVIVGIILALGFMPFAAQAEKGIYVSSGAGGTLPVMRGEFMDDNAFEPAVSLEYLNLGYGITKNIAVGLFYGQTNGYMADDDFGVDTQWLQNYFGLTGRWNFVTEEDIVPYVEAGIGSYSFMIEGDDMDLTVDSETIGYRLASGANYYLLGNFFFAPEISYHHIEYMTEAEIENGEKIDFDFKEKASMVMGLVKIGYHFKNWP
jgi:hypothetical protein